MISAIPLFNTAPLFTTPTPFHGSTNDAFTPITFTWTAVGANANFSLLQYYHAGENLGDPVGYVVSKSAESDYIFSISSPDSDSDGVPDGWESEHFSNPTNSVATANPDGDALNNLQEYIAGMDPNDPNPEFAAGAPQPAPAGTTITWQPVRGRLYTIYWTDDLAKGFDTLQTNLRYPQGSYIETNHTADEGGFYYINVQLDN